MSESSLNVVILGLSITSSWGNGHAATYRGLVRALHERGHRVVFLERDVPWYRENRDLPRPPFCQTYLYEDLEALRTRHAKAIRTADLVIVGSYVPQGVAVGTIVLEKARGITAFYDIDTPVTLAKLRAGDEEYINAGLVGCYDLYLSSTGGPTLRALEEEYGAPMARALHCAVDTQEYFPEACPQQWLMGYQGTFSKDRQPRVESLLMEPARRLKSEQFVVAGPSYPDNVVWPANVARVHHIPPPEHRAFYNSQRFTLNVTRDAMIAAGFSPSVRLFEAAACATPIISDIWEGIEQYFTPGEEILLADNSRQVVDYLQGMSEDDLKNLGQRARQRVLAEHTPRHRVLQLESYFDQAARRQ